MSGTAGTVLAVTDKQQSGRWTLDLDAVDDTIADALRRRRAYRAVPERASALPEAWRARSQAVQSWPKTHFAAVVAGLVAKATDATANPLSLQVGDGSPGRYSASGVWGKFYARAHGEISVNRLKGRPFVNGLYDQRATLTRGWTANPNGARVDEIVGWMEELAEADVTEARQALDAFLFEVPDAEVFSQSTFEVGDDIAPSEFLSIVERFLERDAETGRRAQAFVAACLALVHGEGAVYTPVSVHDPSRRAPGDASVTGDGKVLAAEAKWDTIRQANLREFSDAVAERTEGGTAMYGALVNQDSGRPLADHWRDVTSATGTLTTIYDEPATMLRDAIVWSAKPFLEAVVEFFAVYRHFLQRLEVRPDTLDEWDDRADSLNIVVHRQATGDAT